MSEPRAIPKPASREEWLDQRRPYIGASEALALIGRHEYVTTEELAVRKLSGNDAPPTKAMRRGLTLEAGVARLWEEEHGIALKPCEFMYQRGPFMASPDFQPEELEPPPFFVEVKTSAHYITRPLESWVAQCYVQAYCAGIERVELAVLDATMSLKCFTVDCTTDAYRLAIDELTPPAEAFLDAVGRGLVPDEVGPLHEWAVRALFPRATRNAIDLDADGLSLVQQLMDGRELRRAGEQREQEAKDQLAGLMVDADSAVFNGTEVLSWRNAKDGMRTDWSLLESEHPDLVEKYRRVIPGARTMRVTKDGIEQTSMMPWVRHEHEQEREEET